MKLLTCYPDSSGDEPSEAEAPASSGTYDWSNTLSGRRAFPERPSVEVGCDNPAIYKAILKVRDEYSRPHTVSSLARECGMSVRSLHRLYRSVTGKTIGKDLIARRIEAAADMLREDDIKLEPVAMETGLRNAKNLCRLFKEHLGLTPGQWKDSFHRQANGG
jgi:transcriptional regulator GlxA family with amidase domain